MYLPVYILIVLLFGVPAGAGTKHEIAKYIKNGNVFINKYILKNILLYLLLFLFLLKIKKKETFLYLYKLYINYSFIINI